MKNVEKQKFQKHRKDVKIHKSQRGWAITIMPEGIRIDNYHKPPHLHIKLKGIHIPIKYNDFETIGLIIELHIEKNQGINLKKLIERLV